MSAFGRRLRVLFSEGSSLSARHALSALGPAGHVLDLLDPQPWCLGRFSRYVHAWYRCPPFAADPAGYLEALEKRLHEGQYDVLLPVHDQVYLLSRFRDRLGKQVKLAVPPFAALERLQSKAEFVRLLTELKLGQPATELVRRRQDLESWTVYPCFVKLAYGTAGRGVWHVRDSAEMRPLAAQLQNCGHLDNSSEILIQKPAQGSFCVIQSVFQHGQLVAAHSYQARALGVGGSAWARIGVDHPEARQDLARLGEHLGWHGALHLEYLHDPVTDTALYVDANPRIGETMNATLSGVNFCQLLLQVSLDECALPASPSGSGIRTHSFMMSLLALAQQHASRRRLSAECWNALSGRGLYRDSEEELTRIRQDPWSLLPALVVALRLVLRPSVADSIVQRAVTQYALSERAARTIRDLPTKVGPVPCPSA